LEISDDAVDAAGNLIKYHDTKPGKEYLAALDKAKSARGHKALEAAIYNHLYAFFSRYWQDGDFISKRRYSKRERYAIPYNGEEVTLYWANHDQYYIKTGEYFTDYTWKAANGVTVHFKLTAADVEQNNVKGDKRFFLPQPDEIAWDESARSLTIPFEFRPLTAQEAITYGGKNQQEAIIARAVESVAKQRLVKTAPLALAALDAEKRRTANGESVTYLEHHLRRYTRRNTSDFFIHKDLKGFLSRELDFYLKNEVLNLEEMDAAGVGLSEGWFQMMRLIKKVGGHIIEFLAQIEAFQKMLWEKRKFITETFYCITVGCIPEEFYPEIAACEAQWEEWKALFSIDEGKSGKSRKDRRVEFLKAHPTLVLDTRRFSPDLTDRMLASFDDLDEATDGLLVHSENWQALNVLVEKCREKIDCIYIDPPYNTDSDDFLYKDTYQHSCWLSMIAQRLSTASEYLTDNGSLFSSIDDIEFAGLKYLAAQIFGAGVVVSEIVWKKRGGGDMTAGRGSRLSVDHDYVLTILRDSGVSLSGVLVGDKNYSNPDGDPEGPWTYGDLTCNKTAKERPNLFYDLVDPATGNVFKCNPKRVWAYEPEKMKTFLERTVNGRWLPKVLFPGDPTKRPQLKKFLSERKTSRRPLSSWLETSSTSRSQIELEKEMIGIEIAQVGLNSKATRLLDNILGERVVLYPKPVELIGILAEQATSKEDGFLLDFFAGSGTSGHAVINLNREDGGRRKFILVEMAQYFNTVLLPRIKKVTFSPEWKDGRPKRMATAEEAERSPRIVKVIRLESYEDALNNIAFDEPSGQQAMRFEDYLLQYMLKWETRKSETLLNVEKLAKPFSYQLHIHRNGETRALAVDLPETFAYLLGLYVRKRQALNDNDRRYLVYRGATRDGRKVAAIWRETEGWKEKDYKRDKEFVAAQKLTDGMDEVYVNGDSYIPGARALEKLFKERMFAPVEV
jgi:adenine-specific DNA-methyltransferase